MSKKNGHTDSPPYISQVRLKGYKSILDTSIELYSGLNIIIGPNGSGKTNFLEFLEQALSSIPYRGNFYTYLEIVNNNDRKIWETKSNNNAEYLKKAGVSSSIVEWVYSKGQKTKPTTFDLADEFRTPSHGYFKIFNTLQFLVPLTFIKHTLPKYLLAISNHLTISISKEGGQIQYAMPPEFENTRFVDGFLKQFPIDNINSLPNNKEQLLFELTINSDIKSNLKKFSPIQDIRVDKGLSIKEHNFSYFIDYIGFEFLINGYWLTWNMLSDGTKRLFHLISEVTLTKGLCFVEEPELGVHPDQYRKILNFLKEASEEKQIIITTHAPRTLDILTDKELKKIILTRFDKELGTKMRHLTKEEIKEVTKYREEKGSTSELWAYTGFFDEAEVV